MIALDGDRENNSCTSVNFGCTDDPLFVSNLQISILISRLLLLLNLDVAGILSRDQLHHISVEYINGLKGKVVDGTRRCRLRNGVGQVVHSTIAGNGRIALGIGICVAVVFQIVLNIAKTCDIAVGRIANSNARISLDLGDVAVHARVALDGNRNRYGLTSLALNTADIPYEIRNLLGLLYIGSRGRSGGSGSGRSGGGSGSLRLRCLGSRRLRCGRRGCAGSGRSCGCGRRGSRRLFSAENRNRTADGCRLALDLSSITNNEIVEAYIILARCDIFRRREVNVENLSTVFSNGIYRIAGSILVLGSTANLTQLLISLERVKLVNTGLLNIELPASLINGLSVDQKREVVTECTGILGDKCMHRSLGIGCRIEHNIVEIPCPLRRILLVIHGHIIGGAWILLRRRIRLRIRFLRLTFLCFIRPVTDGDGTVLRVRSALNLSCITYDQLVKGQYILSILSILRNIDIHQKYGSSVFNLAVNSAVAFLFSGCSSDLTGLVVYLKCLGKVVASARLFCLSEFITGCSESLAINLRSELITISTRIAFNLYLNAYFITRRSGIISHRPGPLSSLRINRVDIHRSQGRSRQ